MIDEISVWQSVPGLIDDEARVCGVDFGGFFIVVVGSLETRFVVRHDVGVFRREFSQSRVAFFSRVRGNINERDRLSKRKVDVDDGRETHVDAFDVFDERVSAKGVGERLGESCVERVEGLICELVRQAFKDFVDESSWSPRRRVEHAHVFALNEVVALFFDIVATYDP